MLCYVVMLRYVILYYIILLSLQLSPKEGSIFHRHIGHVTAQNPPLCECKATVTGPVAFGICSAEHST